MRPALIPRRGPSNLTIWLGAFGLCVSAWMLIGVVIYALVVG